MHVCINAWTREYRDERKQRQLEDKMTKKKFGRKERNVKKRGKQPRGLLVHES